MSRWFSKTRKTFSPKARLFYLIYQNKDITREFEYGTRDFWTVSKPRVQRIYAYNNIVYDTNNTENLVYDIVIVFDYYNNRLVEMNGKKKQSSIRFGIGRRYTWND